MFHKRYISLPIIILNIFIKNYYDHDWDTILVIINNDLPLWLMYTFKKRVYSCESGLKKIDVPDAITIGI